MEEKKKLNDFILRLTYNEYVNEDGDEGYGSGVAISDEEDNILHFYFHIFDLCKGILSGAFTLYNLPQANFTEVLTVSERLLLDDILDKLVRKSMEDIDNYDKFKTATLPNLGE